MRLRVGFSLFMGFPKPMKNGGVFIDISDALSSDNVAHLHDQTSKSAASAVGFDSSID